MDEPGDDPSRFARGVSRAVGAPERIWERLAQKCRRAYFGLRFPAIEMDEKTRIARGCRVVCEHNSRIRLRDCYLGPGSLISAKGGGTLEMSRVWVARNCVIAAMDHVSIGEGTLLAEGVSIRDHDHDRGEQFFSRSFESAPVTVGPNVWLGAKVTVLKGVSIASGAVVGANSVVTRSIDEAGTYGGVPARPLRPRSDPEP